MGGAPMTMKKLADMFGVSVSTVSRALRNDRGISRDLTGRIRAAAAEGRYGARRRAGRQICYVIDKRFFLLTNRFFNRVIEGIESESKSHGYAFQFHSLDPEEFSLASVPLRNVAGIIITSCYHDEFIAEVKRAGIPAVLIDYYLPAERISSVLVDNVNGIFAAAGYLASLGHRKVAYVKGDISEIGARDRLDGYLRAIDSFGLDSDPRLLIESDFSIKGAYAAVRRSLEAERRHPTAFLCVNDVVAMGAMEAIKSHGLTIPRDVSVMGFDDIDLASEVIPRISTMHIPKEILGKLAVRRLLQIVRGEEIEFEKQVVMPWLVVRDSTGRPGATRGKGGRHGRG